MDKQTKILIGLLAIFIVAMTLSVSSADSNVMKTFKTTSGYEWKIKDSTWEQMKKEAGDNYKKMRDVGSSYPGYSDSIDVEVTDGDDTYQGIAMAIENDYGVRCEVRGALPDGEYLTAEDSQKVVDMKTFKTSSGYEWEIQNSTWQVMKRQAKNQYDEMKDVGSSYPGYSDSINVTVTKGDDTYRGIALAVQNDNGLRCEIMGVLPDGGYLTVTDTEMLG